MKQSDIIILYKQVFDTPAGSKLLDILSDTIMTTAFTPGVTRPEDLAYVEGQRSVVLEIKQYLNTDLPALIKQETQQETFNDEF